MKTALRTELLGILLISQLSCGIIKQAQKRDASVHTVQFITVDNDVKLEVLDWGGSGRAIILLAGLGLNAHEFDAFAPKLVAAGYHVYGITRRGFGKSSVPSSGYSADRLGDDVFAVINALKLDRPVLVGSSIAGMELSSVGSRYPERISGLIYLDAAYRYAFYDPANGDFGLDSLELRERLEKLTPGSNPMDYEPLMKELKAVQSLLPVFEKSLQDYIDINNLRRDHFTPAIPIPPISAAILAGQKKVTTISVPILAIYNVPKDPWHSEAATLSKVFEKCMPSARVVRLYNADHLIYRSNEQDVLREINAFIAGLRYS